MISQLTKSALVRLAQEPNFLSQHSPFSRPFYACGFPVPSYASPFLEAEPRQGGIQARHSMLYPPPPDNFGQVRKGIFRSAIPTAADVPFLQSLDLKTIMFVSPLPSCPLYFLPLSFFENRTPQKENQ